MPTIAAESRTDNIVQSIYAYVDTNLATGLGLTVYYDLAEPLDLETKPPQWVEVSVIEGSPQSGVRLTGSGRHGYLAEVIVNINGFEKNDARKSGNATIYSLWTVMTNIKAFFEPPDAYIPIRDYNTAGNPVLSALLSLRPPVLTNLSPQSGLGITQKNLSATMRHVAETID